MSFLKIPSSLVSLHDVCRTDNPQTLGGLQAGRVVSHTLRPHYCCKAVVAVAEHSRLGRRGRVAEAAV